MKQINKALVVAFAAIFATGIAGAATVGFECTPFPVTFDDGFGGPTTVTCAAAVGVPTGSILNSVTVNYVADYQFGQDTSNAVDVTFIPSVDGMPPASAWSPVSTTLTPSGTTSSTVPAPTGSASLNSAGLEYAFANGFNVDVSSAVATGAVATSSGGVSVVYDYTAGELVPEPASFALMGGGLIALGLIARRRFL